MATKRKISRKRKPRRLDSVVGNNHRQAALLYLCQHARKMATDLRLGDGFRMACAELLDELTKRAESISNAGVEPRRGDDVGSDALFAGIKPTAWYCDCTNDLGEHSRMYYEDGSMLGLRHPLYSHEDVIRMLAANIAVSGGGGADVH